MPSRREVIKALAERRMALVPLAIDDWRSHDYRQFAEALQLANMAFLDLATQSLKNLEFLAQTLNNAVASVDQAIVLVGREWLYHSLSISMFRVGGKDSADDALLEMSLARARLMELAAMANLPKKECEELFSRLRGNDDLSSCFTETSII